MHVNMIVSSVKIIIKLKVFTVYQLSAIGDFMF